MEAKTSTRWTPPPPPLPKPKRIEIADARSRSYASSSKAASSPSWASQTKLVELGLGLADEFNLRKSSYNVRRILEDDISTVFNPDPKQDVEGSAFAAFASDQSDNKMTMGSAFVSNRNNQNDDERSLNNGVVASRVKGTYARGGVETVLTKKRRSIILTKDDVALNPRPPPGSPTSVNHELHSPQLHESQQHEQPVSRVIARVDSMEQEGAETILDSEMYDIIASIERSINDTNTSVAGVVLYDLEKGNNRCTHIDRGGVESTMVRNPLSLVSIHVTNLAKKLGKESNTGRAHEDDLSAIATIDSASKVSTITNHRENETNETRQKSWFDRNRLLLFVFLVMLIGITAVGLYLFRKEKQNQKSVDVRNYSPGP